MNQERVVILPTEEKHIEDCVRIAMQAWTGIHEEYARRLGEDLHTQLMSGWAEEKAADVRAKQRSGNGYVALLDGEVVGFISYAVQGELGIVGVNAVDADCRGHGIANKMYRFVLDKMRQEGAKIAKVQTGLDDAHAPARRAYEKAGFQKNLPTVTYYQSLTEEV